MESFYVLALVAGILVAFVLLVLIETCNSFNVEILPDADQPLKLHFYHYIYILMEILVSLSCSVILWFSGKLKYEDTYLNIGTVCNGNHTVTQI